MEMVEPGEGERLVEFAREQIAKGNAADAADALMYASGLTPDDDAASRDRSSDPYCTVVAWRDVGCQLKTRRDYDAS